MTSINDFEISPEVEIPFAEAEFLERFARVRSMLESNGINACLFTSPESIYYLTGFKSEWFQVQGPHTEIPVSGVVAAVDLDAPAFLVHEADLALAELTSWIPEPVSIRAGTDAVDQVVSFLRDGGLSAGTFGLELSAYRPSRKQSDRLRSGIESHGGTVSDVTDLMRAVLRRKSPQELAYHRTAARIAEIGIEAARATLRAGVTELEVYGEIMAAMTAAGGENPAITMPVHSGPKSAALHSMPSRRRIMPGEIVNIDVAGVYHRYHSDLGRTFCVGEPAPGIAERVERSGRGCEALVDALEPDRPVSEVLTALREYYAEAGLLDSVWWIGGYELLASFPPDWVGQFSYDIDETPQEDERFPDRLVMNFESNFYLPELRGVTLQIDTVIIDGEAAASHSTPRELIVVDS